MLSQLSYTPIFTLAAPSGVRLRSVLFEVPLNLLSHTIRDLSVLFRTFPSRDLPGSQFPGPSKLNNALKVFRNSDLGCSIRFFSGSCLHRKEVIQPHLPIRLPCYDFTPVANPTFGSALLAVKLLTSGITGSHGVTGGVYKARERIHRGMLIRDY